MHVALVHFPIALLILYSFFELISFGTLKRFSSWFYIKLTLILTGFLFSLLAFAAGERVAESISPESLLWLAIEAHERWASITIFLFGLLAVVNLLNWIENYPECNKVYQKLKLNKYTALMWRGLSSVSTRIYNSPLLWLISLLGLVAVTITGALGASLVYGGQVDFVVRVVYKLLGL